MMNKFEERLWRKVFTDIGLLRIIEDNQFLKAGYMMWSATKRSLNQTITQLKALGAWQ
jgi:hypothetical protein